MGFLLELHALTLATRSYVLLLHNKQQHNIWSCSLSVHLSACLSSLVPRLSPCPVFIGVRGEPGNRATVCLLVCTYLVCHLNLDRDFQVATVEVSATLSKDDWLWFELELSREGGLPLHQAMFGEDLHVWAELRGKVEGSVQGCSSPVYSVHDVCMCVCVCVGGGGGEEGREEGV